MAFDELGRGVDTDVRAEFERTLEDRREEGVVHGEGDVVLPRDRGNGGDVRESERRVRGRLDEYQLGPRRDGPLHIRGIGGVHESGGDAEFAQDLAEQLVRVIRVSNHDQAEKPIRVLKVVRCLFTAA